MPTRVQERKVASTCRTLVGIGDAGLAARVSHEIERGGLESSVQVARNLRQLVDSMEEYSPRVILMLGARCAADGVGAPTHGNCFGRATRSVRRK